MDIVRQAEAIIARGDNPDLTVEDVVTEVPGVCITRLLGIIPPQVYEGNVLMQNGLTAQVIKDSIDKALHFKCIVYPKNCSCIPWSYHQFFENENGC